VRIEFNANRGGLGDLVCAAFLAEGIKATGRDVVFYLSGKGRRVEECVRPNAAHLLNAMGQRVCVGDRGIVLGNHFPGYNYELRAKGSEMSGGTYDRVSAWRDVFPFDFEPITPCVELPAEDGEWADEHFGAKRGPVVGIFPEASFRIRDWPVNKYIDLQSQLEADGCDVRVFLGSAADHDRYRHGYWSLFKRPYHAMPITRVLAAINKCDAVVGNDSGGAHMSGLLQRRTVVLCGPSRQMYEHYGDCITEVRVDKSVVPCVGCHFQRKHGSRAACNAGCDALQSLPVATVREAVLAEVAREVRGVACGA
jgi:hypothetical protein